VGGVIWWGSDHSLRYKEQWGGLHDVLHIECSLLACRQPPVLAERQFYTFANTSQCYYLYPFKLFWFVFEICITLLIPNL
jgi:hypothetical protein